MSIVLSTLAVIIKNQSAVCVTIRICLHDDVWGNGCLKLSSMKSCVKPIGKVDAQIECD